MTGKEWLYLCGATVVLGGCSQVVAGRGGGDETPNSLELTVADQNGQAVAGALVRIRPAGYLPGAGGTLAEGVVDVRSDSAGRISVAGLPDGQYRVEAAGSGMRRLTQGTLKGGGLDLGTLRLALPASLEGRIGPVPGPEDVVLPGTEHGTAAGGDGAFAMDSLPAGSTVLRTRQGNAWSWITLAAGARTVASLSYDAEPGTTLLADFAGASIRVKLGPVLGEGWFYLVSGDSTALQPRLVSQSIDTACGCLHFAAVRSWSELGVNFTEAGDLRKALGFRFRARGRGTFGVRLQHGSGADDNLLQSVTLDSVWRTYELPLASFRTSSVGSSRPDSLASRLASIRGFAWNLPTAGELWIDDIRILGNTAGAMWGHGLP